MIQGIDWSKAVVEVSNYQSSSNSMKLFVDRTDKDFRSYENTLYSLAMTDGECLFCGIKLYTLSKGGVPRVTTGSWDHLIPASHFGLKTLGNLPLVCGSCNNSKGSSTAEDYWTKRKILGHQLKFTDFSEFKKFLFDFSAPYRKKYPKLYEVASTYSPGVSDDNRILIEYFLSPQEDGTTPLVLSDRWGGQKERSEDKDVFHAVSESVAGSPAVGEVSMDLLVLELEEDWSERSNSALFEASIADFQDFLYSSLYRAAVDGSADEYHAMANVFRALSDELKRADFKSMTYSISSWSNFMKRVRSQS